MKILTKREKKKYTGSIVLGLNDAIVETTGALFGLTFALQNSKLIAATGFIVGIAASLSMAASSYLHEKEEKNRNALKSSFYTGFAYLITVLFLISPYFLLDNVYISAIITLVIAIIIIAIFSYYISNRKGLPFKTRFIQMTLISLGVAAISFIIGSIVRNYLGMEF